MIDVFIIFYWLISQLSVPLQCDIIIIIHPLRGIRHFGSYGRIGNSVFHPGIDSRLGFPSSLCRNQNNPVCTTNPIQSRSSRILQY